MHVLSASNDRQIRVHHLDRGAQVEAYPLAACVNSAAVQEHLVAAAIDSPEVPVLDRRTGTTAITCEGHVDHSFGVDWNPANEFQFATCNQDKSVRVWDIRTGRAVHVLCARVAGCLNVQYSRDGQYLVFGEAIDFVHVYDTRCFEQCQIIDVFGNISGVSFNQFEANPKALYAGLSDSTFSSLVEFHNTADQPLIDLAL